MRDNKPTAGRFSEIGQEIIRVGNRKASYICTGNWHETFPIVETKKERPLALSPTKLDYKPGDNHSKIHREYVPPAYMTNPGIPYSGSQTSLFNTQIQSEDLKVRQPTNLE